MYGRIGALHFRLLLANLPHEGMQPASLRVMQEPTLNTPWWALKLAYGIVPIVAGVDKFTNLLTDWKQYLSPLAVRTLPFSPATFMHLVGVIEIVAGVIVLSKLTRLGAYLVTIWLLAIALNLISTGHWFDIAVRDLTLAVGAFALAKLTEVRERATWPEAREARAHSFEPSRRSV
jgi:uncharacterized membrane protein YphA (DoxX/SURF4 family)